MGLYDNLLQVEKNIFSLRASEVKQTATEERQSEEAGLYAEESEERVDTDRNEVVMTGMEKSEVKTECSHGILLFFLFMPVAMGIFLRTTMCPMLWPFGLQNFVLNKIMKYDHKTHGTDYKFTLKEIWDKH
jgi:hypothetical protein